ncbi:DUF4175 family protein [Sunxiuqinia indica]|uniref:DUF4175 family protein n=1 Tax=Sunxiuqinia indica TaxID=2692584 RepID=UPI00135AC418|nr:DUF4175 family protein [Sunxiuqinia indica]
MAESYKQLVDKLNSYIRKYNFYQFLKGFIYFIVLIISYYTVISLLEYFSYLSSSVRTFIFFFTCLLVVGIAVSFFIIPLFRLIGLLKGINHKQASVYISQYFPEIEDRLLNIIELEEIGEETDQKLVWASIDEKIGKINSVRFSDAVSYKGLRKIIAVFVSALTIAFLLASVFPGLYIESSERLIAYNREFVKPSPFEFELLNDSLQVKKGDRLTIKVECKGRELPEVMYVNIAGSNFMMSKNEQVFSYELEHVNNSFTIYFTDLNFRSGAYSIEVLPAPLISNYTVQIEPPAYTGYEITKESMLGDLEVPYGSTISWKFTTADTDSLFFTVNGESYKAQLVGDNYKFEYQVRNKANYSISLKNEYFNYQDMLSFSIEVIPDLYPEIKVVQLRDSTDFTRFYFKGNIGDDYGFHALNYHLVIHENDSIIELPIVKNLSKQDFYYTYDFSDLAQQADHVDYYFSVSDNDYFHNYKETSSEIFQFVFPSENELDKMDDQNFEDLETLMEESFKLSNEIQQSIQELKFKSLSEKSSNWEKQQLVSEILNKKKRLEDVLNQVQQKNKEMNNMKNSFSDEKAEMVEKQKQIEELLEDVFNDELKELFEEFNKLAEEFDQSKFDELSNKSEMSMDDLSKQLERNLQMLKRMKIEQKVEDVIETLTELGQKEKENAQQLDEQRNFEEILSKENDNQEQLERISEDLEQALELNETLDKPMNLHSMDREFNDINTNYDEIGENLDRKRKNKAVEEIENNSRSFESTSFMLNQMLAANQQKQSMENIRDLQQILDNLIYLSLHQEQLHDEIRVIDESDPRLSIVRIEQDRLIGQSKVVKDSLYALAARTPEISSVVSKELVSLELAMNKAVDELEESRLSTALRNQQMAITAANNMALFLNEALDNLQKQMANSMPGDQQCDKPGSGKGENLNMLKQSQQNLKQQLQQMIEQMKSGQSGNMSKEMGQTLAQQEMMQQMIRDLMMNSDVGSAAKEQLKQINQLLEMNNIDLANKNITTSMINRQNMILNKLLKAEKAEMERDVDDERESKTVDESFYSNPIEFFEYKKQDKEFIDDIQRNNFQLRIFYDKKYKDYLNKLIEEN